MQADVRGETGADAGAEKVVAASNILMQLRADPFLTGEVRRAQLRMPGQRMMLGQGQQHRIVQHLEPEQVRVIAGQLLVDQRGVQAALEQAFELFDRTRVVPRDMLFRPVHAQHPRGVLQDAASMAFRYGRCTTHLLSCDSGSFSGLQAIEVGQQGAGFSKVRLAVVGQRDALLVTPKQSQAQAFFELRDPPAPRLLGNVQVLGGVTHG